MEEAVVAVMVGFFGGTSTGSSARDVYVVGQRVCFVRLSSGGWWGFALFGWSLCSSTGVKTMARCCLTKFKRIINIDSKGISRIGRIVVVTGGLSRTGVRGSLVTHWCDS